MKNIEYEYKLIITQVNYEKLQNYLKATYNYNTYTQTNTYFDTPSQILKLNKCAFRIRELNSTLEWTLKKSISKFKKLELKQLTTNLNLNELNQQIKAEFEALNVDVTTFAPICKITTTRTDFKFLNSILSLDYSVYNENPNHYDFELELEILDKNDLKSFKTLLKRFDIKLVQAKNKVARALNFG